MTARFCVVCGKRHSSGGERYITPYNMNDASKACAFGAPKFPDVDNGWAQILKRLWPEVESALGFVGADALRLLVDDEVLSQAEADDVAFLLEVDE